MSDDAKKGNELGESPELSDEQLEDASGGMNKDGIARFTVELYTETDGTELHDLAGQMPEKVKE